MVQRPARVLSCGRSPGLVLSEVALHRHPGLELLWIEAGSTRVQAAGHEFALSTGSVLRIPAGCAHDQRDQEPMRQCHVVIDPGSAMQSVDPELIQLGSDEVVGTWIADLVRLNLAPGGAPEVEPYLIAAILARLDQLAGRAAAQRRLPRPVAEVVRHCEAEPLGMEDEAALAAIAGVSASHLRELFRVHLGQSPGEFRRNVRLQLAQKLLRSSYLGIGEVAAACGWDDANYFARLFKSRCGQSPRGFRQSQRA
jgi:AraC-like DNA-binding protein